VVAVSLKNGNSTGHDPNAALLDTPAGSIFVDCPAGIHPVNGDRECLVGVADLGGVPPADGTWTVRVERLSGPTNGEFDAWMPTGDVGFCAVGWDNPSPGGTISIPGTAQHVITTGAYVTKTDWTNFKGDVISYTSPLTVGDIAPFSSEGPTRDGRLKPELVAPGMGIASARSRKVRIKRGTEGRLRTVEDKKHQVLEGTSMAAPHVAGAAAQLLSLDPSLTATEIRTLLVNNTATDGFTGGGLPDITWGHGKLDVFSAAVDHLGPP
jgi:subtilisin family serine protease